MRRRMRRVSIASKPELRQGIEDYTFFLDYLKILGMVLFAIGMTTPVLGLVVFDVDTQLMQGRDSLDEQLIWDKPILPYIAGFLILAIQWFKFVEVHHALRSTDLKHIIIVLCFFFVLCLYPWFEMNIEFTADQPHSRAWFSAAWGLLGVFSFWQLSYAHKHKMISSKLSENRIRSLKREILGDPVVAVICIGLSYVGFMTWIVGMVLLVPISNYVLARISIDG